MNKIAVIGTGYVGLVSGCCFAESGNKVVCVDIDANKVENLKQGVSPIYEPGLDDLLNRNIKAGRLTFTTDIESAIQESWCIFLCLPTPSNEDGSADLHYVLDVSENIARILENTNIQLEHIIVVNKSTVPVGTHIAVRDIFENHNLGEKVIVASNPEFLREGFAIEDFTKPDRVVIGTSSVWAKERLTRLYEPFTRSGNPILVMDEHSSEMTKYAANAFLAVKISYMNELSQLCEKVGANIDQVRRGIGTDARIGRRFLFPGIGYGGSCFMPNETVRLVIGGNPRPISITQLWETTIATASDETYGYQHKNVEDQDIRVEGFDFTSMTRSTQKVLALTRRVYNGDKITYKTQSGHIQIVTTDHPIFVCANDSTETILAEDLIVGDCVYVVKDMRTSAPQQHNFNIEEVVYVKRSPCEHGSVYSLETENQTVITGNGMVSHNCFPKDVRSIISTASQHSVDLSIVHGALEANRKQLDFFKAKIFTELDRISSESITVAIWGIAFKPNTDDIREAPAIEIIKSLLNRGIHVKAYDPEARNHEIMKHPRFQRTQTAIGAAKDADMLVICTEWSEFRGVDFNELHTTLNHPMIIDGRNLWDPTELEKGGFSYISIGRPDVRM